MRSNPNGARWPSRYARDVDAKSTNSVADPRVAENASFRKSPMKREVAYDSLRDWIAHIDRLGELRTIEGAGWREEIGAIPDIRQHDEKAPAVLFDSIPGYPKGFRILCNAFGGKRQNVTLGFPTTLSKGELSELFLREYREAKENTVAYEWTDTGPVFENILTGNEVDVLKFPTPKWHEGDGGRYIGTGCFNVTQDP